MAHLDGELLFYYNIIPLVINTVQYQRAYRVCVRTYEPKNNHQLELDNVGKLHAGRRNKSPHLHSFILSFVPRMHTEILIYLRRAIPYPAMPCCRNNPTQE